MQIGTIHLTESALKLPKELVIPNDQIQLLNSIGQGEPSCMDYVPCTMPPVSMCTCLLLHWITSVHTMKDTVESGY